MTIAFRESIEWYSAHKESFQYTIYNVIHAAGFHSFAVVDVMSVHVDTGILLQRRVAIHLERLRQYFFVYHVLESLSSFFHAVAFETMTENLVEEHSAGSSGENGGTRIRISYRRFFQGLYSFKQVLGCSYYHILRGKAVGIEGEEIFVEWELHTVFGNG